MFDFVYFCLYQTFDFVFVDFHPHKTLFCDGHKEKVRRDYSEKKNKALHTDINFHKMILNVLRSSFPRVKPKEIIYRNFKNFDLNNFKEDIKTNMQLVDNYDGLEKEFLRVLNNHAPL